MSSLAKEALRRREERKKQEQEETERIITAQRVDALRVARRKAEMREAMLGSALRTEAQEAQKRADSFDNSRTTLWDVVSLKNIIKAIKNEDEGTVGNTKQALRAKTFSDWQRDRERLSQLKAEAEEKGQLSSAYAAQKRQERAEAMSIDELREKIDAPGADKDPSIGEYRKAYDSKKSKAETEHLPKKVLDLLDRYNAIDDSQIGNFFAKWANAAFGGISMPTDNTTKEQIGKELEQMGYGNYKDLAEYRAYALSQEPNSYDKKQAEYFENYAKEHPILASLTARGMAPVANIAGTAGYIKEGLDGTALLTGDISSPEFAISRAKRSIDQTVSQNFEDSEHMTAETKSFLYQNAMSGIDSLTASLLGKPGGSLLAGAALTEKYFESIEKGMSHQEAMVNAACAGIAESLFETISLGNLNKLKEIAPKSLRDVVKNIAKSTFTNFTEEANTEISNILTDYLIGGGLSDYEQQLQAYKDAGLSDEQAKKKTALDMAKRVGEAGLGGALMGGVFGAVGSTVGKVNYEQALKQSGTYIANTGSEERLLASAYELGGDNTKLSGYAQSAEQNLKALEQSRAEFEERLATAKENGTETDEKGKKQEKAPQYTSKQLKDLGHLEEELASHVDDTVRQKAEEAVKNRLDELGENKKKVDKIKKAVVKAEMGKKLTAREKSNIKNSEYGQLVLNELSVAQVIPNEEYSYEWASRLQRNAEGLYKTLAEPNIDAYRNRTSESRSVQGTADSFSNEKSTGSATDAVKMSSAAEETMSKIMEDGQNKEDYERSFKTVYQMAKSGYTLEEVMKSQNAAVSDDFTDFQKESAFTLGQDALKAQKQIKPQKISRIEENDTFVLDENGNEVGLSEADTDGGQKRLFYSAAMLKDVDAANVFVSGYKTGVGLSQYGDGFKSFFNAGKQNSGTSFDSFITSHSDYKSLFSAVGEDTARLAFERGAAITQKAQNQKKAPAKKVKKRSGSFVNNTTDSELNAVYEAVSKKLGIDIVKEQSLWTADDREANAQFIAKEMKVLISSDAQSEFTDTVHELGHLGEVTNKEAMQKVRQAVLDWHNETKGYNSTEDAISRFEQAYNCSREDAIEEYTNEALSGLFSTDEGVKDFLSWLEEDSGYSKKEKKTVIQKIAELFDRLVEAIKNTISSGQLSFAAKDFAQMQADRAAKIRKMFLDALDGTSEQSARMSGEVKNSIKKSYVSMDGHFLSYRETGGSDANEQALRWSARDSVKDGDQKLAYCNGSWYIIEKDSNDYAGYQVVEIIRKGNFNDERERIKEHNRENRSRTVSGEFVKYDFGNQQSDTASDGRYGSDVDGSENQAGNRQVLPVDRTSSQRGKTRIGSGQNTFGSNENRKRTGTERLTDSEVKNSLKLTDSEGNELSAEQREFFENSKVRDEDSNLLVVYHGTDVDFTVFDRTKSRSAMDIQGSFFSPWELDAQGYGSEVKPYYLNITNPASEGVAYKALNRFKGQNYAGVKAREYLEGLGYDGVNNGNEEYIAFYPQQIKAIENLNPTDNPDIRYSLKGDFSSDTLQDNLKSVSKMDPVSYMDGNEFEKGDVDLVTQVEQYFNRFNNVVNTSYGNVIINRKGIKDSLGHGIGRNKAIAFKAVPQVLKKGLMIDYQTNRKNRGYNTAVISAPVVIKDENYYMAVVVVEEPSKNTYYLHEVALSKKEEASSVFKTGTEKIRTPSTEETSVHSLLRKLQDVNSSIGNLNEYADTKSSLRHSLGIADNNADSSLLSQLEEQKKLVSHLQGLLGMRHFVDMKQVRTLAGVIKKDYNSTIGTNELVDMLGSFYESIATSRELSWDVVEAKTKEIAEAVVSKSKNITEITERSKEILADIRSVAVRLSDKQKAEVAHRYGSYNDFRRRAFGSLKIRNGNDIIELDSRYSELSNAYPDLFPADVSEADQPALLLEAYRSIKDGYYDSNGFDYDSAVDYLKADIYEKYFEIPDSKNLADDYRLKLNRAKLEMRKELEEAKTEFRRRTVEEVKKAKAYYEDRISLTVSDINERYDERLIAAKARYEQRVQNIADTNSRAAARKTIVRKVKRLSNILLKTSNKPGYVGERDGKKFVIYNNIPEELRVPVSKLCELLADTDSVFEKSKLDDLKSAYGAIRASAPSDETFLSGRYDAEIEADLEELKNTVAGKRLSRLSASQLDTVKKILDHFDTMIKNETEIFVNGRAQLVSNLGEQELNDLRAKGRKKLRQLGKAEKTVDAARKFAVNNYKPIYFFEKVGGVFKPLFNDIRKGQDKYVRNIEPIKDKYAGWVKKYGVKKALRDNDTVSFTTERNEKLDLTLQQRMLIYATAKREQLSGQKSLHLMTGGVVFENQIQKSGEKTRPWKFRENDAGAHPLSLGDIVKIANSLTSEQKGFVDELVSFLSTDVANWGNDVSMKLYGYRKFTEKYYIPFNSANSFGYQRFGEQGESLLRSMSFTKQTVRGAASPLVLSDFTQVWAKHIERMSAYNAMVVPLENLGRVFNYKTVTNDVSIGTSVASQLETSLGKDYKDYIVQFVKDVNGNVMTDSREDGYSALLRKFKKSAVFASASVAIQQPSAIMRAFALVDSKYFLASTFDSRKSYEECKKYAPVALLKEIGGFDTVSGRNMVDYILKDEYTAKEKPGAFFKDSEYRDEVLSFLPGKADEITWAHIWNAVKREQAAKTGLRGEQLLEKAGERFTEVIERTQVYDSVLTRSANMRSKSAAMQTVTAFMAEPTTTVNMLLDAYDSRKTDRKKFVRVTASVTAATLLNSVLKSLITANRDDDEDKTFAEKYISQVIAGFFDDMNPLSLVPLVQDIISLLQGYDVNRSDMDLFSNLVNSIQNCSNDNLPLDKKLTGLLGSFADFAGIPLKNIFRDAYSARTAWRSLKSGNKTTEKGIKFALEDEMFPILRKLGFVEPSSKQERLYEAWLNKDSETYNRLAKGYKSGTQVKNALIDNIKKDYLDGLISEGQAEILLEPFFEKENKAYYKIRGWTDGTDDDEEDTDDYSGFYALDTAKVSKKPSEESRTVKNILSQDDDEEEEEEEAYAKYSFLENAVKNGDISAFKSEIADLKKHGISDDTIKKKVKSYLKKYDDDVYEAGKRYASGDVSALDVAAGIANKYGIEQSTVEAAVRSVASVGTGKKSIVTGTNAIMADVHLAVKAGDSETSSRLIQEIIAGKMEEGKTQKEAYQAVRQSLNGKWRAIYLAASSSDRAEIRRNLYNTGAYASLYKLDATISKWIKNQSDETE